MQLKIVIVLPSMDKAMHDPGVGVGVCVLGGCGGGVYQGVCCRPL